MADTSKLKIGNNTYDLKDATARSGLNNKQDIIQKTTLPTASATEEGHIYQYTGTTENGLVNGYFYKCVKNGSTYSWVVIDFGSQDISGKADKVTNATSGNFAGLDANGNLTDSGKKATDFANASHTHTKSQITDFPTLGTAAAKDIPSSGNASSTQVVMGNDSRLSDTRTPKSHTHTKSEISDFPSLGTASAKDVPSSGNASSTQVVMGNDSRLSDARTPTSHTHTKSQITDFPTLGTAAAKDVPTSGNASTSQVVMGNDSRLSDARTPTAHTHTKSEITDFPASLPASDTVSTYSATGTAPVNGTAVAAALGTLDVASVGGSGKYISTISETDGKISATAANMPTSLPASDTTSTYSATGTAPVNGTAVAAALGTLDVSSVGGSGKYIQAISETDGKISATAANMPTSLPASDVSSWAKASTKPSYTASEVGAIATTAKGAANGVAELDSAGKVPSSQLPSFVDDVLEYDAKASFPTTGETGKIYVDKTTNLTWRWSGTAYVEISPSLALGETSSTAYRGDRGKTAYTHATDSNRLTTAKSEGLYKIATTAEGHVKSVTAVAKSDITGLGIPAQDTTYSAATQSAAGLMSATDKTKLDGVATGAEVNQNAFSNVIVGSTTIAADGKTDTLTLVAGSNVTLTPDATNDKVTIAATDTTYSAATQSTAGLMSATDKTKLDGIATGATANTGTVTQVKVGTTAYNPSSGVVSLPAYPTTLPASDVSSWAKASTKPSYTASEVGAATSGHTHSTSIATSTGTNQITLAANTKYALTAGGTSYVFTTPPDTNTTYSNATTSAAGLMSATDKAKLDGIASGAQVNAVTSVAGKTGAVTLSASDVGAAASSHNQASNTINAMTGYSKPSSTSAIAATDSLNTAIGKLEKALDGKGTSSLTIGTTATTAAAGNHTHSTSIATSTGTNQITLAANTKYALTAGGTSYVFTTPPDTNTTYSAATQSAAGLMSAADKTKLDGVAAGATALSIGTTATTAAAGNHDHTLTIATDSGTSAVDLAANTKYKLTAGGKTLIFKTPVDNNTTYSAATQSAAGLMSSTDKTKLDGIATGATANIGTVTQVKVGTTAYNPSSGVVSLPAYPTTLPASDVSAWAKASTKPSYTASEVGAATSGHTHTTSIATSTGTNQITLAASTKYALTAGGTSYVFTTPPNTTYSAATQSAAGLMSAADKTKLDGVATGATANTGNVTGSSLTANTIILGNGSSAIKTSSKTIETSLSASSDTAVPTSKAVADYVATQIGAVLNTDF